MNIYLFVFLAAPFFSLLFTQPVDLLIDWRISNKYL
jgi:hypothetical protein